MTDVYIYICLSALFRSPVFWTLKAVRPLDSLIPLEEEGKRSIFLIDIRAPDMGRYGGIWGIPSEGYSGGYSGIQWDTVGYSGIQRNTAGYYKMVYIHNIIYIYIHTYIHTHKNINQITGFRGRLPARRSAAQKLPQSWALVMSSCHSCRRVFIFWLSPP